MKIELKSLSMHNFLHYYGPDVETIEFPEKNIIGIMGKNGAGKSTILDALLFTLFGKDTKGKQNACLKKGGFAEAVLMSDSTTVMFKRAMNNKGSVIKSVRIGSDKEKIVPDKEYTKMVQQYIGLDHLAFINSAFITQDHLQDLGSTQPAKRLGIFKRIFSLVIYDKFKSQVEKDLDSIEKRLLPLLNEREMIGARIAQLATVKIESKEKINASLQALNDEKASKDAELTDLTAEMASLNDALSKLSSSIGKESALKSQLTSAEKELQRNEQLRAEKPNIEASIQQLEQKNEILLDGNSLDGIDAEITRYQQSRMNLEGIKQSIISINKNIDAVHNEIGSKTKTFDSRITTLRNKISEIENNGVVPFDKGKKATYRFGFLSGKASIDETLRESLHEKINQEQSVMNAFNPESSNLTMLSQELVAREGEKDAELAQLQAKVNELIENAKVEQEKLDAMDENTIKMQIETLEARRKASRQIEHDLSGLQQSLALITAQEDQAGAIRERIATLQQELESLSTVQAEFSEASSSKQKYQAKIDSLNLYLRQLEGKIKESSANLSFTTVNNKDKMQEQLDSINQDMQDLEQQKHILTLLNEAFSQKGIVNECLVKIMPYISSQASQHAITLSDGRITAIHLFKTATGVDVELSSDNETRTMQELSGGEKVMVNLAIRFAICQVLSQMTQVKVETIFLDEADMGSLDQIDDDSALDLFMTRLHTMNQYFSNIIVISQIPRVLKYFNIKYNVFRSAKGYSKIQKT